MIAKKDSTPMFAPSVVRQNPSGLSGGLVDGRLMRSSRLRMSCRRVSASSTEAAIQALIKPCRPTKLTDAHPDNRTDQPMVTSHDRFSRAVIDSPEPYFSRHAHICHSPSASFFKLRGYQII